MFKRFKKHIEQNFPYLKGSSILLGCSGGIDSVVLAHLCHELKMDFALAHCNFKLRGTESDDDQQFVENLGERLGRKVFTRAFDTLGYMDTEGGSVQMAARELRYSWFRKLLKSEGYDYLFTAHQADDDLETFLINLSRGTGIVGLKGIPAQNESIVRPLLPFFRNEIFKYADENNIGWREDSSNAETKYLRNKIRHDIVPELKELHPTFLENFQMTQKHLQSSSQLLQVYKKQLHSALFKVRKDRVEIDIEKLEALHPIKDHIHLLFNDFGFTDWSALEDLLNTSSGKEIRSATHRLVKDRKTLLLQKFDEDKAEAYQISETQNHIRTPFAMRIEKVAEVGETAPNMLYVDKETLNYPLLIRKWQKGDYFYPFGMKGKKKVGKFFKDEKIDILAKQKQWLLCSGQEIVWIIGKRADERFKVTGRTKNIIKFTLL
ncbi:tRNA lysidine(34) synthetase TilS [Allomuricauda sp. SCSIO 65647]|uniref:tRNA lysidine(34) synthetase TilS n=1 Tax=Allomuricauda sp. SCSIO 65647 TaxID=2908843 RepID=UPI001F46A968|nr:tRNA lysidine(34) synthetase TilS [Muricauda sp. SCSIO 65647]UJH67498.1 tRNA lysidine(34) synthetase TilS [Muricauda sp. SCSIO 65647]